MGIIRSGIHAKFIADSSAQLYIDLGGTRLYYAEAPEQPIFPYCVFSIWGEIYEFTFDMEFEDVLMQFDYFATTANDCDTGVADIKTMFDYAILTLTGYTCLRMEREMVFPPSKIMPDNIWSASVRYSILMKKN